MNVPRRKSWMWAEACALLDEAEHRHRHFYELLAVPSAVPAWEPPANIFTRGAEVHVMVALPGARAEDVATQIIPSGLLIEATVPPPAFEAGVEVMRLEIPYGRMRRRIELAPGTYSLLEHRLDRGYLFVRLKG
jgi:HSP20 family protein